MRSIFGSYGDPLVTATMRPQMDRSDLYAIRTQLEEITNLLNHMFAAMDPEAHGKMVENRMKQMTYMMQQSQKEYRKKKEEEDK